MRRRWYAPEFKAEAGIMRKWRRRAAQVRRELGISEIVLYQLLGWPWHPNRRATAPEMLWQKRERSAPLRQKNDQPHKEPDFFTRTLAFLANGNWLPDHRPSRRPLPVNALICRPLKISAPGY
jgi:hypothetical protein